MVGAWLMKAEFLSDRWQITIEHCTHVHQLSNNRQFIRARGSRDSLLMLLYALLDTEGSFRHKQTDRERDRGKQTRDKETNTAVATYPSTSSLYVVMRPH